MPDPDRRVLVAMSGGVDSSVAACLLKREGFDVVGVFMVLRQPSEHTGCCSRNDKHDAMRVAKRHGFKFQPVDFTEPFRELKRYFLDEYERGRTPNPCVECNRRLKFDLLVQLADRYRCRWIATGHYVRSDEQFLYRGVEAGKDQSYALALTPPGLLPRLRFPVGELPKERVRALAMEFGLENAGKRDSQDVCFIQGRYQDIITAPRPGTFVSLRGEVMGEHAGYQFFTRGQRKGIGVPGPEPYYVIAIRPGTAEVVIGTRAELERVAPFSIESPNWFAPPEGVVDVQCRYHSESVPCDMDGTMVHPHAFVNAVPGQLAAFYSGARLLGGGWIAGP